MARITNISLTNNDSRHLVAQIAANGDLQLVGCEAMEAQDLGDGESHYTGDIEYTLTVAAADKDTVLLHLLEEKFESESEIGHWLQAKGVAGELKN